ncbi:unnamed protein product [Ixodes pacificus]
MATKQVAFALLSILFLAPAVIGDPILNTLLGHRSADSWTSARSADSESALAVEPSLRTLPGMSTLSQLTTPLILLGIGYYVLGYMPTAMPMFLGLLGLKARLLPYLTAIGLRENFDLDRVGRQLESSEFLERGFDYLEIKDTDCRRRAACEMGEWLSRSHPVVAKVVDVFSENMLKGSKYSDNLLEGARHTSCDTQFPKCPSSPLRTLSPFK